ncbi:secreted RxLR effector protein 161-like [Cicer arietinum]|uniref:secreted RxLR effector protein 161-like n=1 Tax=Cicer arietinum TaxID=3827 RepID=UPI003CC5C876
MEKEFEMIDLGMLSYFLGNEFVIKENGTFMHQKKYANDVLRRFKMQDCNSADTPSEADMVLSKEGSDELVDTTTFKQLVGSLRYLCNTQPYIAHSVRLVSRYMEKPRTSHYLAAKRILRYIKETSELGLHYAKKQVGIEDDLIGFTDADWCGDKDDRKSTSGYVFMINESSILWCSKKQNIVALSTCEAEYVVASMGAC